MKKQILMLAVAAGLSVAAAHAQTDRGTVLVGLSGNASFSKESILKSRHIQFTPRVGYFVSKNIALGGMLDLDDQYFELSGFGFGSNENTFDRSIDRSVSAFARFYIGDAKVKPYVNAQAGYGWLRGNTNKINTRPSYQYDGKWQAALGAGVSYFVTPRVALEAEGNFRFLNRNEVGSSNALNFRLGLALYLRK